jgi:glyoxylate reductase
MQRPTPPHVFVTRQLPGEALDRLAARVSLRVWDGPLPPPPEVLRAEAREAHGLITLLTDRVDAGLLAGAPHLRAVSNVAVGYDNIDVAACTARRIAVGNTPGVLTETSADFTFALLLGLARRVAEADAYVRAGRWKTWEPGLLLGVDVHGATLGIVGLGAIGTAVARRARGFGMRVLYVSRERRPALEAELGVVPVDKATLLAESDFVTLHVPLSASTRHWLGGAELAAMKRGALLINTARGPVVDPEALAEGTGEGAPGGGGAGCDGAGALARGQPPGEAAQRPARPAHREREPRHAGAHGLHGGGQPDCGTRGAAAAPLRQPGALPMNLPPALFTPGHDSTLLDDLKARIRDVPDFPKPGILFKDVTPVLADPRLFGRVVNAMSAPFRGRHINKVVGVEARGFLLGAPIALALHAGFAPGTQAGKAAVEDGDGALRAGVRG